MHPWNLLSKYYSSLASFLSLIRLLNRSRTLPALSLVRKHFLGFCLLNLEQTTRQQHERLALTDEMDFRADVHITSSL